MLEVKICGDNPTDFLAKLAFVAEAFGVARARPIVDAPDVVEQAEARLATDKKLNGSAALVETLNDETQPVNDEPVEAKAKAPAKAPAKVRAAAAPKVKPEPVAEVEGAEDIGPEPTEPAEEKLTIDDIKGLARGVLGSHPDGITAVRGAVAQITGTPGQVATVPSEKWPALAAALRARLEDITNV